MLVDPNKGNARTDNLPVVPEQATCGGRLWSIATAPFRLIGAVVCGIFSAIGNVFSCMGGCLCPREVKPVKIDDQADGLGDVDPTALSLPLPESPERPSSSSDVVDLTQDEDTVDGVELSFEEKCKLAATAAGKIRQAAPKRDKPAAQAVPAAVVQQPPQSAVPVKTAAEARAGGPPPPPPMGGRFKKPVGGWGPVDTSTVTTDAPVSNTVKKSKLVDPAQAAHANELAAALAKRANKDS